MKNLNTSLLILLTAGLIANFYLDFKRDKAAKVTASIIDSTKAKSEPSPFDNLPTDPTKETALMPKGPTTDVKFDRMEHDFGEITEGDVVRTTFKYTNKGDKDLLVSSAIGSCGCTVPGWSEKPVKPGETEEISVQFDAKGKSGQQVKTVTVTTNTLPPTHQLLIKAHINPRKPS